MRDVILVTWASPSDVEYVQFSLWSYEFTLKFDFIGRESKCASHSLLDNGSVESVLKLDADAQQFAVWQLIVGTTQDYTTGAGPLRPFSAA
jgi:hypothetical protein